ncbi:MAG TPA: alpha/beta fold hydrolase [Actinomycetota bacterium]
MPVLTRPDGCRLYYETHGPRVGQPILLLEGLGGDIPGWRRNIPVLAQELFVVAFDLRGNGRSDAPDTPVTMATFVEDAVAVLRLVGVESAHAYGQSFGGMIAMELALTHPERVRSLILAATTPGPAHAVAVRSKVPKDTPWVALYAPGFPEANPAHVADDLAVGAQRPQSRHGRRRQWEAMQAFDAYDRLPSIDVPVLVLHGTADRMVSVDNARILADRIPGAELHLIEGAGHLYHSERAAEADATVRDFVRRHARG